MPVHAMINLPNGQTLMIPQSMAGVPIALPNLGDEIVYGGHSYVVTHRAWIFDADRIYIQITTNDVQKVREDREGRKK